MKRNKIIAFLCAILTFIEFSSLNCEGKVIAEQYVLSIAESSTVEKKFVSYLKNSIIPEKGISFNNGQFRFFSNSYFMQNLIKNGLCGYYIAPFNDNDEIIMITSYIENSGDGQLSLKMQLYTINQTNEVVLSDEISLCTYFDMSSIYLDFKISVFTDLNNQNLIYFQSTNHAQHSYSLSNIIKVSSENKFMEEKYEFDSAVDYIEDYIQNLNDNLLKYNIDVERINEEPYFQNNISYENVICELHQMRNHTNNYFTELSLKNNIDLNCLYNDVQNDSPETNTIKRMFADMNGDNIIDGRDASALLTYYAKTSTGYKETIFEFMNEFSKT